MIVLTTVFLNINNLASMDARFIKIGMNRLWNSCKVIAEAAVRRCSTK